MPVRWTDQAFQDLERIFEYIEQYNPKAAVDIAEAIIASGDGLAVFPRRNPVRYRNDIRERIVGHTPYILLYRIEREDLVIIMAIRHGARADRVP